MINRRITKRCFVKLLKYWKNKYSLLIRRGLDK
jgi:hypothetical protein